METSLWHPDGANEYVFAERPGDGDGSSKARR